MTSIAHTNRLLNMLTPDQQPHGHWDDLRVSMLTWIHDDDAYLVIRVHSDGILGYTAQIGPASTKGETLLSDEIPEEILLLIRRVQQVQKNRTTGQPTSSNDNKTKPTDNERTIEWLTATSLQRIAENLEQIVIHTGSACGQRRDFFAAAALTGILARARERVFGDAPADAIEIADALIKQLDAEES